MKTAEYLEMNLVVHHTWQCKSESYNYYQLILDNNLKEDNLK